MWGKKEDQKKISELSAEILELRNKCEKLQAGKTQRVRQTEARALPYPPEKILCLETENSELRKECERLRQAYTQASTKSQGRAEISAVQPQPGVLPPAPTAPVVSVAPGEYEEAMVATLNLWWQDPIPERKRLLELLKQLGLPASFYTMSDIEAAMQTVSWNGPYLFRPSEQYGEWLWCELKPGESALLLPADPALFTAGPILKILQRIVVGCETVNTKPQFRSASTACRLALFKEKERWYRVNSKGIVWVDGHPKPPAFRNKVRTFDSFFGKQPGRPPAPPPALVVPVLPLATSAEAELLRSIDDSLKALRPFAAVFEQLQTEIAEVQKRVDRVSNKIERIKSAPVPPQPVPRPAEIAPEIPPCVPLPQDALKRAYALAASAAPSNYLARLDALHHALKSELPDLRFEISHLSLQAGRFARHPARIVEPDSIVCAICGRNPGNRLCFLTASAGQSGAIWALIPPGDLSEFDFPNGYPLLLDPAPTGVFTIEWVSQPALLRLSEPKERLFRVVQKMVWGAIPG